MKSLGWLVAAFALAWGAQAQASWHAGAGPVDEIDGEGSWLATVAWLTDHEHPYEFIAGRIAGRDGNIVTPDVFYVSASKRFTWRGWFAQGGIAYADVDNEVLSKHFQFQTGIGYDFGRISISLRHLSNANTGGRNRGETFLLADVGF
jgi:Lipid A 3-O-deacylase (PagL)